LHKAIYNKSHFNKFTTVLLPTGDNKMVKRLFYVAVQFLTMGRWGTKHVAVDVVKHFVWFWQIVCIYWFTVC